MAIRIRCIGRRRNFEQALIDLNQLSGTFRLMDGTLHLGLLWMASIKGLGSSAFDPFQRSLQ